MMCMVNLSPQIILNRYTDVTVPKLIDGKKENIKNVKIKSD